MLDHAQIDMQNEGWQTLVGRMLESFAKKGV